MNWDHPDRHKGAAPQDITDDRVQRVMDAVMARLDAPQATPKPNWIPRLANWWAEMIPAPRYAMPIVAALVLGLVVGQGLQTEAETSNLAVILSYSSVYAVGY
ncbi:hypothetical protein CU669_05125 [Paramagnetospirillum kuznetsovii]|uniref:Uncharacterized protein n=1 Tax=Paramagnetospirillum kuznetsovii TaxID=2053833 RepID=A0A364P0C5_9PROT|nr:hypothetical protein [Paramagnetospirillum kuznetsovii]RAU22774.1 hypothetical protein CU669_05125 [Paramagnetospirillum kuznetsovii]